MKYIATRPRAERLSEHGLFGDEDGVVLDKAMVEMENYTRNVWTHIISLKREDAARLGFDNAAAWRDLLRAHRNDIAAAMKISPNDFRWCAAFHDEGDHPHVHMMAWSAKAGQAYAVDAMAWAVTQGIISGTSSTTIAPTGLATRSQAAVMLMRFDKMGEGTTVDPEEPEYETIFRVMNAPPLYPGDTIEVGDLAFIAIGSEPYGANVAAGVTYTVTCSDPSMVKINRDGAISRDEVCYSVEGLKAGTATITAVGSDGFRGSVTITIKGDETNPTDPDNPNIDWGEYAEVKEEMIRLTNEERVRNGLSELEVSERLMSGADIRADECTISFSHTRPNGGDPIGSAEILAATSSLSASRAVDDWTQSAAHHKIMLNSKYNYIGVGVAQGTDGRYYYVELFSVQE